MEIRICNLKKPATCDNRGEVTDYKYVSEVMKVGVCNGYMNERDCPYGNKIVLEVPNA